MKLDYNLEFLKEKPLISYRKNTKKTLQTNETRLQLWEKPLISHRNLNSVVKLENQFFQKQLNANRNGNSNFLWGSKIGH